MNTRQLKYVIAVAEEHSFTNAAKKLFIAQPSLSQFIHKLEQDLGFDLFDRKVTPLRLTAKGEVYVETARRILDLERQMEQRLFSNDDNMQFGRLTIGVSPNLGHHFIPVVIKQFSARYPRHDIVLEEHGKSAVLEKLDYGEFDIGITTLPVHSEELITKTLFQEDLLLAVPSGHPINDRLAILNEQELDPTYPLVDIAQTGDIPYILVGQNLPNYLLTVNDIFKQAGFQPHEIVRCNSLSICQALVSAGVGAAFLYSTLVGREYSDTIKYYSISQEYTARQVAAVYRKNQYVSQAALDFVRLLSRDYDQLSIIDGVPLPFA